MKSILSLLLPIALILAGCSKATDKGKDPPPDKEAKIHKAIAELPKEEQKLAEAQKYCAVAGGRLGSLGKPYKVMVAGKPVFLCCEGCEKKALADPEKTLAKVEKLKEKAREEAAK